MCVYVRERLRERESIRLKEREQKTKKKRAEDKKIINRIKFIDLSREKKRNTNKKFIFESYCLEIKTCKEW